ncbi:SDR family oxidoreductase [Pikeienuella piscinae]|uniref:SDR family oxidoreductase n=1 Tax=Pikeienuella piscinae TaxID=2748098 RepID=A0A7L5C3T4_9RHOB|nr:SDR family oxidoreductase [Pikeienuella piscinae]QIE56934.1 SDR family oxidoreductase [Pikeienuella piscinae]
MPTTLITGANRGIGLEISRRLAARGDNVLACARAHPPTGERFEPVELDVTMEDSLAALSTRLDGRALDLLVCNAGRLIGRGGVDDPAYSAEAFAEVLAVNVTGVFMTIRACLPALRRAKGRIAVISSQMGSSARAKGAAYLYRASKAAATNLSVSLSKELGDEGIAVGAYHPGWVRTDMGGGGAAISVEESAAGLIARFDELNVANAGRLLFYSGEEIPF